MRYSSWDIKEVDTSKKQIIRHFSRLLLDSFKKIACRQTVCSYNQNSIEGGRALAKLTTANSMGAEIPEGTNGNKPGLLTFHGNKIMVCLSGKSGTTDVAQPKA